MSRLKMNEDLNREVSGFRKDSTQGQQAAAKARDKAQEIMDRFANEDEKQTLLQQQYEEAEKRKVSLASLDLEQQRASSQSGQVNLASQEDGINNYVQQAAEDDDLNAVASFESESYVNQKPAEMEVMKSGWSPKHSEESFTIKAQPKQELIGIKDSQVQDVKLGLGFDEGEQERMEQQLQVNEERLRNLELQENLRKQQQQAKTEVMNNRLGQDSDDFYPDNKVSESYKNDQKAFKKVTNNDGSIKPFNLHSESDADEQKAYVPSVLRASGIENYQKPVKQDQPIWMQNQSENQDSTHNKQESFSNNINIDLGNERSQQGSRKKFILQTDNNTEYKLDTVETTPVSPPSPVRAKKQIISQNSPTKKTINIKQRPFPTPVAKSSLRAPAGGLKKQEAQAKLKLLPIPQRDVSLTDMRDKTLCKMIKLTPINEHTGMTRVTNLATTKATGFTQNTIQNTTLQTKFGSHHNSTASNMLPYIPSQITLQSAGRASPFLQRNPQNLRPSKTPRKYTKMTEAEREHNFNLFQTGIDFRNKNQTVLGKKPTVASILPNLQQITKPVRRNNSIDRTTQMLIKYRRNRIQLAELADPLKPQEVNNKWLELS